MLKNKIQISILALKLYVAIAGVFVIIDSLRLVLYPLIFFGFLADVESVVRSQLPIQFANIDLAVVFAVLIINVVLRVSSLIHIVKMDKWGLILGLISCCFTILIVVFLLTSNLIWETAVMVLLAALVMIGYNKIGKKDRDEI